MRIAVPHVRKKDAIALFPLKSGVLRVTAEIIYGKEEGNTTSMRRTIPSFQFAARRVITIAPGVAAQPSGTERRVTARGAHRRRAGPRVWRVSANAAAAGGYARTERASARTAVVRQSSAFPNSACAIINSSN
ncbi:hypothetical protein EVAR_48696_1 [Eumeta japonica]|uniref:Uncharacterized protein n=1 Tax=Eumeta variegata TaxID=151549 RepID=A0A4C1XD60_EUMVA|nr:hypothetical protein EVAR_48696_1 [Eumeta japonica]